MVIIGDTLQSVVSDELTRQWLHIPLCTRIRVWSTGVGWGIRPPLHYGGNLLFRLRVESSEINRKQMRDAMPRPGVQRYTEAPPKEV
jgi:hypothetical protein